MSDYCLICVILTLTLVSSASVNRRRMCNQIPQQVLGKILGPAYNSRYMSIELPTEIDVPSVQDSGIKRAPANTPAFYVGDDFTREYGDTPAWETSHLDLAQQKISKRDLNAYNYFEDEMNLQFDGTLLENKESEVNIENEREEGLKEENLTDSAALRNISKESFFKMDQVIKLDTTKSTNEREKRQANSLPNGFNNDEMRTLEERRSFVGDGDGETVYEVEKRSVTVRTVRQWQCQSRIRWLDLGPDYFPRYLRSVECTSTSCWYDMLKCTPRSFTVKLLRRKRDRCVPGAPDEPTGIAGLPAALRELWVWEERAINFCCDCSTN